MSAPLTRRGAIRARCLDCSGGSWKEVRDCKFTTCDLHPFRLGDNPGSRTQAMRKHCLWCCNGSATEVRLCPAVRCAMHPFRLGSLPKNRDATPITPTYRRGSGPEHKGAATLPEPEGGQEIAPMHGGNDA